MNKVSGKAMIFTWRTALCGLAAVLALSCCDFMVAGTSVGTGNPTEISVAFKNDSDASAPVTGTLSVYASTQIPVPGFSPAPLLTVPLDRSLQASLNSDDFQSVPDSLWPKTSVVNGVYKFNMVVSGETQGAILKGFSWRKADKDFVLRAEDKDAVIHDKLATIRGAVSPLVEYKGMITDSANLNKLWDYYLFIYGTGFSAKAENGVFKLPNLPSGKHASNVVLIPIQDHQLSGIDSTNVFGLTEPMDTGKNSITIGSISDIVPLPDSLKIK
jgi:hypothetical protein